jgi:hypothetical protein
MYCVEMNEKEYKQPRYLDSLGHEAESRCLFGCPFTYNRSRNHITEHARYCKFDSTKFIQHE